MYLTILHATSIFAMTFTKLTPNTGIKSATKQPNTFFRNNATTPHPHTTTYPVSFPCARVSQYYSSA